jgi:hypothetical protein
MSSPDVPSSDDAEFKRLIASLDSNESASHPDTIDVGQLQPLGRAAVTQLMDPSLYTSVVLRSADVDRSAFSHDVLDCEHDTICGLAGYILTVNDEMSKPKVEPLLLPPYGLSAKAFLEHCRDLIRPYSHYQLGEVPLTQNVLNKFLESQTIIVASVAQMTAQHNTSEICTTLKVPASFLQDAAGEPNVVTPEDVLAHGVKETATVFDWLSSHQLSNIK